MTEYTYLDGIVRGKCNRGYFTDGQSLNLDFATANSLELTIQEQINQQQLLSPTAHERHDSLFQCSPSITPAPSIPQHQADAQLYPMAPMTPHDTNRPVTMSRSASQFSSTSSGHYHENGNRHRASRGSFGNASPPIASDMSRSTSKYSVVSTIQRPAPQPHLDNAKYQPTQPSNLPPITLPTDYRYDLSPANAADPMFHFDINDIMRGTLAADGNENTMFGQVTTPSRHVNFSTPLSPSFRLHPGSSRKQKPLDNPNLLSPSSDIETLMSPHPMSSIDHSPLPSQHPACRRRRRAISLTDASSDPVIGQVTRLGKFKCLDPACDDLTFGRQADFKRHYENVHAPRKIEYFCPEEGCSRSRKPAGGKSKGRSFNSRKDKMEEHLRTVHYKGSAKRRRLEEDDYEDEEDGFGEGLGEKRLGTRRRGY